MGTREQAAEKDFSGIPLEEEVEESLKESAVISMGTEISEMDLDNIVALCDQVRHLLSSASICHLVINFTSKRGYTYRAATCICTAA